MTRTRAGCSRPMQGVVQRSASTARCTEMYRARVEVTELPELPGNQYASKVRCVAAVKPGHRDTDSSQDE
jgi:hypothetical protein